MARSRDQEPTNLRHGIFEQVLVVKKAHTGIVDLERICGSRIGDFILPSAQRVSNELASQKRRLAFGVTAIAVPQNLVCYRPYLQRIRE